MVSKAYSWGSSIVILLPLHTVGLVCLQTKESRGNDWQLFNFLISATHFWVLEHGHLLLFPLPSFLCCPLPTTNHRSYKHLTKCLIFSGLHLKNIFCLQNKNSSAFIDKWLTLAPARLDTNKFNLSYTLRLCTVQIHRNPRIIRLILLGNSPSFYIYSIEIA